MFIVCRIGRSLGITDQRDKIAIVYQPNYRVVNALKWPSYALILTLLLVKTSTKPLSLELFIHANMTWFYQIHAIPKKEHTLFTLGRNNLCLRHLEKKLSPGLGLVIRGSQATHTGSDGRGLK